MIIEITGGTIMPFLSGALDFGWELLKIAMFAAIGAYIWTILWMNSDKFSKAMLKLRENTLKDELEMHKKATEYVKGHEEEIGHLNTLRMKMDKFSKERKKSGFDGYAMEG